MNQNSLQTDRKTRGHHHKLGSAIRPSFSVLTDQVLLSLPVFLCLSLYPSRDPIVVCSDGVAVKQTDPWVLTEIPISLPAISLSFRSESPSPSWPTKVVTGDGELGFDSREGARETATTSKEGSRRANYPILTRGVKKLVVEPWDGSPGPPSVSTGRPVSSVGDTHLALTGRDFDPIVLAFGIGVMINRDSRGHSYFIVRERKLGARRRSDTVLVSTINDADQGSADVAFRTPLAPYEKSKFLGSGGSMVARLKLKGIDGRAPPGVEPAA
uniref:Uncharacterized protein n=1 Tax=Brassica oleracea var. oleracea TaxID=109376 RepID=A0A0D2ZR94_BRAOL